MILVVSLTKVIRWDEAPLADPQDGDAETERNDRVVNKIMGDLAGFASGASWEIDVVVNDERQVRS